MHVAGFAPVVQPLPCRLPVGYGWANSTSTDWGDATVAAALRFPVDQAETRRAAAASGVACGDVAAHVVVVVVEGAVGGVVGVVAVARLEWLLVQPAAASAATDSARTHRIGETLPAQ